jgi:hypothetical protein
MTVLFVLIALFGLVSFWGAISEKPLPRFFHRMNPLRKFGEHYPKVFGLPIFVMAIAIPFPITSFFADAFVAAFFLAAGYGYLTYLDKITKKTDANTKSE